MGNCPTCVAMPLEDYAATSGVHVGLCKHCRGMFVRREDIRTLTGGASLTHATDAAPLALGDDDSHACPGCEAPAMEPLSLKESAGELWQCRPCGGLWLPEGAFFALRRSVRTAPAAPVGPRVSAPRSSVVDRNPGRGLAHSRSRFDAGVENLVGVPLVMAISALVCATPLGRLFAAMVGMPFHELGHAAASWLSSRIAVPLPFFTFWLDAQSVLMGLLVAGALGWLGYRAHQEGNRFATGVAATLFVAQLVLTLVLPADTTRMWQILSGALAELLLGAFLLVAFHFPLPDRLRWDFWRWVAIVPAALCFTHALRLWHVAANDLSQMPWGAALGADSDGDMNRLVGQFGWSAQELAAFYLHVGYACTAAIAVAYGYAWWRYRQTNGSFPAFGQWRRRVRDAQEPSR
ncbi:MAG: zf-TFIIB domain-containing protein [Myxococcota bacterium]